MDKELYEDVVIDFETNGLLTHEFVDYLASPYKLKPTYSVWCLVMRDIHQPLNFKRFDGEQVWEFVRWYLPKVKKLIAHNGIDFDFLVLKLAYGVDYEIAEQCTVNGQPVDLIDTLVLSKVLNPDRYGGHSLDEWGKRLGIEKIDWRKEAIQLGLIKFNDPKGAEFAQWHPNMGVYCERDTDVNVKLYWALVEEMGDWPWAGPFALEQMVRDIITRQSHRGFYFDRELAERNVRELDEKMEAIKAVIEPLLPPKPMGVTKLKAYLPPKLQFKKNGEPSAALEKWIEKHSGKLITHEDGNYSVEVYGKVWNLPMDPEVPVQTHEPATVRDTTHIKGWLVELGWRPSAYKERDLTKDSKKNALSKEKYLEAVDRYVEQTLESPFCRDRCEELDVTPKTLRDKLLKVKANRPMKVLTNPTFTVGQEKEMDPRLLELGDKFPHAKMLSEYLTYAHRRNSILGGGFDPDDLDDEDEFAGKGFLAAERIGVDGRIPTPADSCGAGTSRMKHRLVANIPRATSLYGENMRAMFGTNVKEGYYQLGYDFASLEAMIEAHYCWRYDDAEKTYCLSLTREKPNDVHTKTAEFIQTTVSAAIGKLFPFKRTPAKSVKYCCSYGGQPKRVAKTVGCEEHIGELIHSAFWEAAKPLARLGEKLKEYWETTGGKKFILGIDGRKIPTRSASALINSLFQSAGVICAKRSMVIHERKLKEAGLWVDFFRDDWKNKPFVQQLIAYHK